MTKSRICVILELGALNINRYKIALTFFLPVLQGLCDPHEFGLSLREILSFISNPRTSVHRRTGVR